MAEIKHPEALAMPYGLSWTALDGDEPICCAGVVEVWEGRAYAWALLSEYAGPHLLTLTRVIRSRLASLRYRRVEMAVDAGFDAGCRWAKMLGFRLETPAPMRGYLPNGRSAWLYARCNYGNGNPDCDGGGVRDGRDLSGQRSRSAVYGGG